MNFSDYCSELMKQSFSDSTGINYTPLALMLYLKKNNYYFTEKSLNDLLKFIYRFYVDNPKYAKENSNVIISNIGHYYFRDIKSYVAEQLNIWMKNGSGILLFDGEKVIINNAMNDLKQNEINMLNKIIDNLMIRNLREIICYESSIDDEMSLLGHNVINYYEYINFINNSRFVNRAFEELDYCVCCEETDRSQLQAMHINKYISLSDENNSLVFCKEHANLYFNEYFKFNKVGKIIIKKNHPSLDRRMHLSNKILKYRKAYFEE